MDIPHPQYERLNTGKCFTLLLFIIINNIIIRRVFNHRGLTRFSHSRFVQSCGRDIPAPPSHFQNVFVGEHNMQLTSYGHY